MQANMSTLATGTPSNSDGRQSMDSEESEKSQKISNAVQFLHDPRVKLSPVANKIRFLKSKSLTAEEVYEAFEKAGQITSLDEIKRIMESSSAGQTGVRVGSTPVSSVYGVEDVAARAPRQNPVPVHIGPLYVPQAPPFPHEDQRARETDWRDVVIGVGAALISGFSAFKAFQIYSPYEVRRKDEEAKRSSRNESGRLSRRRERQTFSDKEGEDCPAVSSHTVANPLSSAPLPPLPTAAKAAGVSSTVGTEGTQEEIQKLQRDLKETQEALDKEKKSKAELSVTLGKLRGQVNAMSRTNEKLESKVKTLQEELDKARSEVSKQTDLNETATNTEEKISRLQVNEEIKPTVPVPLSSGVQVDNVDSNAPPDQSTAPTRTETEFVQDDEEGQG